MNTEKKSAWTTPHLDDVDADYTQIKAGFGPSCDGPSCGTSDFS